MKKIELLELITKYAKDYVDGADGSVKRNQHMNNFDINEYIRQDLIDALIVDYINFIGMEQGVDYGLYTEDLRK